VVVATIRRGARACAIALAACGIFVAFAPAASADPKIPFSQDVYARTHLAKSGIDITVPANQSRDVPSLLPVTMIS